MIADSVNLANAKRRAHEWKLRVAAGKGHMPFEEGGAYLLDEIIRLENLVFAQQKNLEQIARVSIPTDTMEQEFQSHHRRGFDAGRKQPHEPPGDVPAAMLARIEVIGSDWRSADSHFKADACSYLVADLREQFRIGSTLTKEGGL